MGNVYSFVLGMVLCFACPLIGIPFLLLGVVGAFADDAARNRTARPASAFISGPTTDARLLKMILWTLCICLPLIGVIFVLFAR